MSGETERAVSGWTTDTLHESTQRQLTNLRNALEERHALQDKLLDERYATQTKAVDAAFAAQQVAMQTAFVAADKAVDKALEAAEKAVIRRQDTLDREFHEHLEQVRHENHLAFLNSDKAVEAALSAQEKAVTKAEAANEKRFESVNEFRGQLNDQAALFLPRTEYAANHQNLADRVTDLTDRINRNEGKSVGMTAIYGWGVAAMGLLISCVIAANAIFGR